ncbi:MAG: hypothetical protein DA407_07940 [Bacteroidetes bacterium]|nr:MAG: hypothetical protein DA407_07940 [Bacteroidota bacterium]
MINYLELKKETVSLFKNCFDDNNSPKNTENIGWQFFDNTSSNSFVTIAFDDEKKKPAAIYAVSCVKFKVGDTTSIGTQSLDTITDIDYRGQGFFIKLAKDVYSKAQDSGMALVYGFPNGNSIHGFAKKLEWTVLDPLPFLIKPLKSQYFTKKIKALRFLPNIKLSLSKFRFSGNYLLKAENHFPDEVNKIWEIFSSNIEVAVVRDKAYLDWRYIQKPNEDYKILHCWDKKETYLGFVIYAVKEKHNGSIGYIMELMYDLKQPKSGEHLLSYAVDNMKKEGADCILSWCLEHSPNYNIYKKEFFLYMPEKIRPIELHFGVRSLQKSNEEIIGDRKNWYISYSDSDTV